MKRPHSVREPADRRISPRTRVHLRAQALDPSGAVLSDCLMKDRSAHGARLVFPPGFTPPSAFILLEASSRRRYPVRLVWCADREAGVTFVNAPPERL